MSWTMKSWRPWLMHTAWRPARRLLPGRKACPGHHTAAHRGLLWAAHLQSALPQCRVKACSLLAGCACVAKSWPLTAGLWRSERDCPAGPCATGRYRDAWLTGA